MIKQINLTEIILYVSDQKTSAEFYEKLLRKPPDLNVPGMAEFIVSDSCKIGLMPNDGIARILGDKTPHPSSGSGIPRCELYLHVDDIHLEFENAKKSGAIPLSPVEKRSWGDTVCYFSDPDGHIIAFAEGRHPTFPNGEG
ncbi:MAG: lactoylglutathione lyase [Ignavibacteria bacterium]|nr:lactoylglutathione lyase [Ignavibacteria bacterium]